MFNVSFPKLGLNFNINPEVFPMLDNVHIRWYGVIIAVGMLLALAYAYFSAERFNVNRNKLIDCVLVGIVTGIIGARLYYVLFELDRYIKDPVSIFMINEGGLAIYGGIIGGLLGGCCLLYTSPSPRDRG